MKFLRPEYAGDPDASARFLREARAAIRIKSEHVARMLDADTLPGGIPYIVMEYLEGCDLEQLIERRGPLPPTEAVDAIIHACAALSDAHARGVIHRDLKPANLFRTVAPSGQTVVKILDFGISKITDGVDRLTRTQTTMGSALYMSPEQLKSSRDVDARTDIYALGVTLFELLSGHFLFIADTMPQLVAAVLSERPLELCRLRPDLSPELCAITHRAFARAAGERFATAAELAAALAPFASSDARALAERIAAPFGAARATLPSAPSDLFAAPPPREAATLSRIDELPSLRQTDGDRDTPTAALEPARPPEPLAATAAPLSRTNPRQRSSPATAVAIAVVGVLARRRRGSDDREHRAGFGAGCGGERGPTEAPAVDTAVAEPPPEPDPAPAGSASAAESAGPASAGPPASAPASSAPKVSRPVAAPWPRIHRPPQPKSRDSIFEGRE